MYDFEVFFETPYRYHKGVSAKAVENTGKRNIMTERQKKNKHFSVPPTRYRLFCAPPPRRWLFIHALSLDLVLPRPKCRDFIVTPLPLRQYDLRVLSFARGLWLITFRMWPERGCFYIIDFDGHSTLYRSRSV